MNTRHLLLFLMLFGATIVRAQFGSFGDVPIEITQEGETRWENGVAVAEKNVEIHYGSTTIYTDYAQYNPNTRDVLAIGNVRIYRDGSLFVGDRALYNLETKLLRTANFRGEHYPFLFQAETANSIEGNAFEIQNGLLTTSDSSKPDYYVKAKSVRIYPNDSVVFTNATLYIGRTPVFWFPWMYQNLKKDAGFSFTPGYGKGWGAYLLTQYGVPISDTLNGIVRFDLRSTRGAAGGFDLRGTYGADETSWVKFSSYYADDLHPTTNDTALNRGPVDPSRYRIALQNQTFFTPDIYASIDINKLSDNWVLHDFFPAEYRRNPNPDNLVALTDRSENYTITGLARIGLNNFFDTTERLPEVVLDVKRQPLFGSQIFYEGQTGAAELKRNFGTTTAAHNTVANQKKFVDFEALRLDTFHQLVAPQTLGGWLNIVPRIGVRGTYYSRGAKDVTSDFPSNSIFDQQLELSDLGHTLVQRQTESSVFRPVFNAGVEASFKMSREWEEIQSRSWGLDGLRHVIQPYTNLSFVKTNEDPSGILQFDRLTPSTQLPPIDFPQFTTTDTIADWSILRLGVRNRLETRRDDRNLTWFEMDSFVDAYLDNPNFPVAGWNNNRFSNFYNRIAWAPLPWATLSVDSQLPLFNPGFTQVNTSVSFMPTEDFRFSVSHRYLTENPYFKDSDNVRFSAYYRINDNWGVSISETYEVTDSTLQRQEYAVYRDLSSWIASLGLLVRDNINPTTGQHVIDTGLALTFSLKAFPSLGIPLHFDPSNIIDNTAGNGATK